MPQFPPEILRHIFRLLEPTQVSDLGYIPRFRKEAIQDSKLDLLAASLVCSNWFMEAWTLVDPSLFQMRFLVLQTGPSKRYLTRLYSLLAESLRYGLTHCDHLEGIQIRPNYMIEERDPLHPMAAVIHQVVRLQPLGLRSIEISALKHNWSAAMIELLDGIFPPGEVATITQFTIHSDRTMCNDVAVHLLERFGPTLRNVSLYNFQFDVTLMQALGRCRGLECLSASGGQLRGPDARPAPPGAVAILAAALPNLVSLKFSMENCDKVARVSDGHLREIVTRLPALMHLAVDVDFTVNDESLRFVMHHAKAMEVFALVGCRMLRGEGVWTENDVGWRGLKELRLSGATDISSSFIQFLRQECPGLAITDGYGVAI